MHFISFTLDHKMRSRMLLCALIFAGTLAVALIIAPCLLKGSEEETRLTDISEIVRRMEAYSRHFKESMPGYASSRSCHVEYTGIMKKSADMIARVTYSPRSGKSFEVKSESGSKLLRNKVLRKILESEVEAAQPSKQKDSAITPENYEFRLIPGENPLDSDCYVLEVKPRKKAKFLFIGKIWIDGKDFAITRLEGRPAVNPSWWTTKATILHTYRKVGDFWMHDTNESTSEIRIGGRAILKIHYEEYKFENMPAFSAWR
jgi:hypothetical protein